MRVAIIEFWPVHEEVVPSWIFFFNSIGIIPDIFINERGLIAKGNIFDIFEGLKFNLRLMPLRQQEDWIRLGSYIKDGKYDALVINSFQTVGSGWASTLPGIKVCLVHNVIEFYGNRRMFDLAGIRDDIKLVTLSQGSAGTLHSLYKFRGINKRIANISASYFEHHIIKDNNTKTNIGIVGGINFNNRDYGKLISTLKKGFDRENIIFKLIGGGQDSEKLFNLVTENGLNDNFIFSSGANLRSSYRDYFDGILSCKYLITLFKPQTRYHYSSVSSVINFSLGFSVPLLQDSITSQLYRVPGFNIDDFNGYEIFNSLSKINPEEHLNLRKSTEQCNKKRLEDSILSLTSIIY